MLELFRDLDDMYGFEYGEGPILLEPHGSLNWFDEQQARRVKEKSKVPLASSDGQSTYVYTISFAALQKS